MGHLSPRQCASEDSYLVDGNLCVGYARPGIQAQAVARLCPLGQVACQLQWCADTGNIKHERQITMLAEVRRFPPEVSSPSTLKVVPRYSSL